MPLKTEKIKEKMLYRSMDVNKDGIDVEKRTVEFFFSSEQPVERWFGMEILDHTPESIDMSRVNNSAAALWNHDWGTQHGVIERCALDQSQKKCAVIVRFSKKKASDEIFQDVVDGIIRNVSFGYTISKRVLEKTENDMDFYRVTSWMPYEVSFVSVPADVTVGVGRASGQEATNDCEVVSEERQADPKNDNALKTQNNEEKKMPDENKVDHVQILNEERSRGKEIRAIGEKFKLEKDASDAIESGMTVEGFRKFVLDKVVERNIQTATAKKDDQLGLSDKEKRSFSFIRAINALSTPGDAKAQSDAGYEREVSVAFAQKRGLTPQGIMVPPEILAFRDFNLTTGGGSNMVATNLLPGSFIEKLDNAMLMIPLGARLMRDLVGNVDIPRQTGRSTGYWIDPESEDITAKSQPSIDQVSMTPKTVGAYTDLSRRLLKQSSLDAEALVRNDLVTTLALALDLAAICGTGLNNQPKGIIHQDNIGSLTWDTANTPSWAKIVELETKVDVANALIGNMAYLMESLMRGKLKTTPVVSGFPTFIMDAGSGMVNGYRSAVSNQVPDYNVLFGNFADVLIGMWGGLDLTIDTSTGALAGKVRVVTLQDADVAIRRPESFALGTNPTVS